MDTVMAIHKDRSNISASLNNTTSMIKSLQMCLAGKGGLRILRLYPRIAHALMHAPFTRMPAERTTI